jgi:serine/threonine-protein kinase RsbT
VSDVVTIAIDSDADIVAARQRGRELAQKVGFTGSDLTMIATAISEIARNIVVYARRGDVELGACSKPGKKGGIVVVAKDEGPGIADVDRALTDGFSTGGSLGLGLPGARRLMDELEIITEVGKGTTITMRKWLR